MSQNQNRFSPNDFGHNLRRVRNERRLTQEEVAEGAGISSRYVALIEAGSRNPTLGVILDIAYALGVPPVKLFRNPT